MRVVNVSDRVKNLVVRLQCGLKDDVMTGIEKVKLPPNMISGSLSGA